MNALERTGKRRTIRLSASILLLSVWSTYFYQSVQPEINFPKLFSQIVRFILTVLLLFFVYKGNKWARIIALILFSAGLILAVIAVFTIPHQSFSTEIPFYVMIIVYADTLFHFGFSRSFKAFMAYQNHKTANS